MKYTNIEIGEWYKNKEDDYGYYKALEILKPQRGENNTKRITVKCLHSSSGCNDKFGIIRYLKPVNIVKIK